MTKAMSTLEPTTIIRAGGLVPTSAKIASDVRAGTVAARRYAHPAIPGKTVVRIVPDAMAPGADIEMDTLGFARGEVSPALGKGRLRALGFPGWALINDPARASFALEVMKDFKRAAKQIRSKPGNAREAFLEIGARLARSVPHFLPSFWEEAGRRFLLEESTTFAAQSFEKARLAEKEHALEVDEDTRSAAYLEFALAGAVAAKSLTGYAKELQEAYGPEIAYARYLELATRRVLGGMPPWTGLAKELRGLAKAAKKDLDVEDEAFLEAVLDAPAIARAPGEMWTTYDASLVRLAKKSPALQRRLRHLFPNPSSQAKDFRPWWFAFLERAGALEGLWEVTEGEPELAEWLSKMIAFTNASPALYALLPKLVPRLLREGKPVNPTATPGGRGALSIDFAEKLLEAGVGIVEPRGWMNFNLAHPITVDPVRIQADPVLGPRLLTAVENVLGTPEFETASQGKVGLARARRAWLEREVANLSSGALFAFGQACFRLTTKVRPTLWAEHPDLVAAVKAANIAAALARSLRGGVLAEWTWPAFEELSAKKPKIQLTGAWPFPVFHDGIKAQVLGAEGVVFEHDFVLPPKGHVNRCLFIDGDLFVIVNAHGLGQRAYWASSPHDLFELEGHHYWSELPTSIAVQGGGVTLGDRAIFRGDRDVKVGYSAFGDGTGVWVSGREDDRYKLFELDPKTGTRGRASWPSFMTEMVADEERDGLRVIAASFAPAPPGVDASPLGQRDGVVGIVIRAKAQHGTGLRQLRRIDGGRWEREGAEHPRALVSWPGDSALRAVFSRYVRKPNGGSVSETQIETSDGVVIASLGHDNADNTGWPAIPSLSLWCYLRPRDEAGSKALRAVDTAAAERLLASAESGAGPVLAGVTAPALAAAVTAIVKRAATLRAELQKVATSVGSGEGNGAVEIVNDREATVPLGIFFKNRWAGGALSEDVVALSDMVLGKPRKDVSISHVDWDRFIGRLRGLAVLAMLPGTEPKRRETIAKLLRIFARTVFASGKHTMRVFRGSLEHKSPLRRTKTQSWVITHEGSTYALRSTDAGDEDDTDAWDITAIELCSDGGAFKAPPGVTISEERTVAPTDDTTWLGAFDAVAKKEPPPWDPAAAETFAAATGLTRAAATLILAGIPNIEDYDADFLGKELREKLGLKTTDAKLARESVKTFAREKILETYARSAPDDPNGLLEPWSESGFAARLAGAFAATFGTQVQVREDVLVAFKRDLDPPLADGLLGLVAAAVPVPDARLLSLPSMIAWLYMALPAGDPYRDAVPGLLARIDQMLADPKLVLALRKFDVSPDEVPALTTLLDTITGEATTMKKGPEVAERAVDGGAFLFGIFKGGQRAFVEFRPAKAKPDDPIGRAIATSPLSSWGDTTWAWKRVQLLRSPGLRALVDRIGKLAPGAYEANPAASAPDLVAKVAKATKLSSDAACHYLQLLALAEPTAKSVQLWNGWKPAQYKKTCDELLAQKLVVAGKRERAGREIFLPGAWDKKSSEKGLPTEGWKKDLYPTSATNDRILPARPLPEIFAEAWKRIEAGDIPKLDEV